MASNGPYAKLSCETIDTPDGGTEILFSGKTKNAADDNNASTEFSGVVDNNGNIKGNYKELNGFHVELSASTDGSGFREIPQSTPETLAETAQKALSGPAKACSKGMLPWAPSG